MAKNRVGYKHKTTAKNLTIIYYTSNREREDFEQKIRSKLLEAIGDKPLISVSQKSIDFGHNICIGDVGASYHNEYRQIEIGAKEAKTKYVALAESDMLYPPGYFDFEPQNDLYIYNNFWILRCFNKHLFVRKEYGDALMIIRRTFLLERLKLVLAERPEFCNIRLRGSIVKPPEWKNFDVGIPVISVKTKRGMSLNTGVMGRVEPEHKLPYWGSATDLSNYLDLFTLSHEGRDNEMPIA